ncbi:MAG: tetratricopeptide repeat protein, partial [Planctomycetota bacterium]
LDHPGIVKVLEAGEHEGNAWFAMELVEGEPLSRQIKEREFTWQEAVTIVRDVADALAVAHAKGVLHRDIKPSNILMDADGKPHLTDFGLAKDTRTESKYTRTGEMLGTPAYMSPEQARGDLAQLTPATDTWALGCVLYELLGGRPAFSGDSAAAVIGAILTGRFEHLPGIEPRAWDLIAAALQANPAHRPANGAAWRDDADRVLRGACAVHRARRRGRPWIPAVLAVAGVAGVLVPWALLPGPPPLPPAPTAAQRADAALDRLWAARTDPATRERVAARLPEASDPDLWRLRLGLLCWMAGDGQAARAAWADVSASSPHQVRALFYTGVQIGFECHDLRQPPDPAEPWLRRVVDSDHALAPVARIVLEQLGGRHRQWKTILPGDTTWIADLLRANSAVFGDAGDRREAIRLFDRVIDNGMEFGFVLSRRGVLSAGRGDAAGARADYDRAIARAPGLPQAYLNRGNSLVDADWQAALRDFDRAIELFAGYPLAHYARARVLSLNGRYAEALESADRAVELDPADGDAWNMRGLAKEGLGDLAGAAADWRTALDRTAHVDPALNLGVMLVREGRHAEGLRLTEEALRRSPDYPEARYWQAKALVGLRRGAEAEAVFSQLIERGVRVAECLNHRSTVRGRRGDRSGAVDDLRAAAAEAQGLERQRPVAAASIYRRLAEVELQLRRYGEALRWIDRARAAHPGQIGDLLTRGLIHANAGDADAAMADWSAAIDARPDVAEGWGNRGKLRMRAGDAAGALADLDRAIALNTENPTWFAYRGRARWRHQQYAAAMKDLDEAVRLDSEYAYARFIRADFAMALRQYAKALEDSERYIAAEPKDPEGYIVRGGALRALGRPREAEPDWDRAIALGTDDGRAYYYRSKRWRREGNSAAALADLDRALEIAPEKHRVREERADLRLRSGRTADALADLRYLLARFPKNPRLLGMAAAMLEHAGDVPGAIEHYRRALAAAPKDWDQRSLLTKQLARLEQSGK